MVVTEGFTEIEFPVPTSVPPQDPLYHFQLALLPKVPPCRVSVTLLPVQIESAEVVIEVGAVERVFTFIALLTQAVVLHVPSARTK